MKIELLVIGYLIGWIGTWGAVNASFEYLFDQPHPRSYREDLDFSCGISLIPITWFVAPFMTGFYEHGWRLSPRAK